MNIIDKIVSSNEKEFYVNKDIANVIFNHGHFFRNNEYSKSYY